jgi:hypothetical protein
MSTIHWETSNMLLIKRKLEKQVTDMCKTCPLKAQQETPIIGVSKSIPLEKSNG